MFQDPRSLSFLLLPAITAVSAVAAILSGTGSVNLEESLQNQAPDLAYVDDEASVSSGQPTSPPEGTDGQGGTEVALPTGSIPLAPTTTGPPPSVGPSTPNDAPNDTEPAAPTTGATNPGSPAPAPSEPPSSVPTNEVPGTNPAPTDAPTTNPPTSGSPTTKPPTTPPPTTKPPTTKPPTTKPPTTKPPTTAPPTQPAPATEPIIGVLIEGESTSDPNGGWNNYPADVATNLGSSIAVKIDGQNGVRADQINAEGSKAHLLTPGSGHNVAVLWVGINDISQARQPNDVYAQISAWSSNRRNEGWDKIVLVTVTKFEHPNSLSWGSHAAADQKRQELNSLIVANGAGADAVVDLRNVEGIGDGYSVHDTNWRPDKIHLSQAGNQSVARHVAAAVQSLGS